MADTLPDLYFRIRENGAAVFRRTAEPRDRRLEMEHIAALNMRSGEIRAHKGHVLTPDESAAINAWMDTRRGILAQRAQDEAARTVEALNLTAHWALTKAEGAALEAVTDDLLMAMHDLRAILVRKKADRLGGA